MKPVLFLAAALAVVLAGCDRRAPSSDTSVAGKEGGNAAASVATANDTSAAAPEATGDPDDPLGSIAFVGEIYQSYLSGQRPDFSRYFTAELNEAVNRMELGHDPFCMCQDFANLGYSILRDDPAPQGGRRVEVEINKGEERQTRVILLTRESGGWRVANIGEGEDALYKPEGGPKA